MPDDASAFAGQFQLVNRFSWGSLPFSAFLVLSRPERTSGEVNRLAFCFLLDASSIQVDLI